MSEAEREEGCKVHHLSHGSWRKLGGALRLTDASTPPLWRPNDLLAQTSLPPVHRFNSTDFLREKLWPPPSPSSRIRRRVDQPLSNEPVNQPGTADRGVGTFSANFDTSQEGRTNKQEEFRESRDPVAAEFITRWKQLDSIVFQALTFLQGRL
ncbi:unnamed protein product [Pleuronectes platessa]|uniref:Uncharacterized protein n=1 Tax=Pleuronectes platessa TaxID=8262 RepID=A0A9N7TK36_PLEPL|nr:unnamed protein product [Pleuronectes platessa]